MLKPTKNFKMPSVFKYLMSTITNKGQRDVYKSIAIQATLQSLIKPVKEKSKLSRRSSGNGAERRLGRPWRPGNERVRLPRAAPSFDFSFDRKIP